MPLLHLVILAVIQGVTEFLPISSSGHLVLYPLLTEQADQGLALDVAVHVGTLAAVMLYFRSDVATATRGAIYFALGDRDRAEARLAFLLVISTIPVVIAGGLLSALDLTDQFRSIAVIGWMTIIWGVVLYVADMTGKQEKRVEQWSLHDALWMGVIQIFALVPGTSRSGVTMTMARSLGYARVDAARLAMLMSIPTIIAAGVLTGADLAAAGDVALGRDALIGGALAFVAALLALIFMMRMLRTWSMTPFVVYRMILGAILLWWAYA